MDAANAIETNESTVAPTGGSSKFLRIPKEIRLQIYRYLLLPSEYVSIAPGCDHSADDGESKEWTDEESTEEEGEEEEEEEEGEEEDNYNDSAESLAGNKLPPLPVVASMIQQEVRDRPEHYGPQAHAIAHALSTNTPITWESLGANSSVLSRVRWEYETSTGAATRPANNATTNSPSGPVSSGDNSASDKIPSEWVDTESDGDGFLSDDITRIVQETIWRRVAMNMGLELGNESDEGAIPAFLAVVAAMGTSADSQIISQIAGAIDSLNREVDTAWLPETNENAPDEADENENHELGMRGGFAWDTALTDSDDDEEQWRMYPEILRVNKQIYDEASSLLYTEGTVVIDVYDIFCLNKNPSPDRVRFGAVDDHIAWRYNPLEDSGTVAEDGTVTYSTPDIGGLMEPHVFARFQKVLFDATFDEVHFQDLEFFLDLDTGKLNETDVKLFQRRLRRSPLIKDLVKLLSKSSLIKKFTINLLLEVRSESRLDEEETESEDEEDDENAEREEGRVSLQDRIEAADLLSNQRATEAFMDANIWRPLRRLRNVRTFEFRYGFADYTPPVEYEPPKRHVKIIEWMKRLVEGNFGKGGGREK
ncbi:hypothetical protein ACMFMG_004527 [Clarireedia jacksonii]